MRILTSVLLVLLVLSPAPAQESATSEGLYTDEERKVIASALKFENEMVRLVAKIRPSSVSVENWQRGRRRGVGSGVIVSSKGHVFTNQHVVQGADEIWISLWDRRRFQAKFIGNDESGDIALLKISAKKIKRADPEKAHPDRLTTGEWVIATGNPFGLALDGEPIVSLGVISGLGRIPPGRRFFYGKAIQHDARINPGNSGGPLWDSKGNLLGINGKIEMTFAGSASRTSAGVSYAIPIDQVRNFLKAMLGGEDVGHGHQLIGLDVETATDDDGVHVGARVKRVVPGSPAAKARAGGVKRGDVIWKITVRGKPREVRSVTDYINVMSPLPEGSKVTLHVKRGRKRIVFSGILLGRKRKR
ncbi:MAG: S1C family serine protease [Planctomycetota bacterium]|jgi:serine protease Do